MTGDQKKDVKPDDRLPNASPYGPWPDGVDEASGGADSSPLETMSSDERIELARKKAKSQGLTGDPPPSHPQGGQGA